MPESFNKKYSLDFYIYNAVKELPKSYCVLEPNYITLFNYLISFLLLYFIYYDKSLLLIFLLAIFRTFLDILDGAIARKCNKYSNLGNKLDHYGDLIFYTLILLLIYFKLKNKYMNIIFLLFFIYILYLWLNKLFNKRNKQFDPLIFFVHDNTLLLPLVLIIILYIINNK